MEFKVSTSHIMYEIFVTRYKDSSVLSYEKEDTNVFLGYLESFITDLYS